MEISLTNTAFDVALYDVKTSNRTIWWAKLLGRIVGSFEKKLVNEYTRVYTEFEGLLTMIKENPQTTADYVESYQQFGKIISMLTWANPYLREAEYLNSERLKDVVEKTMNLAYEIEAELKIACNTRKATLPEDTYIKQGLSANSSYSLSTRLSHQF